MAETLFPAKAINNKEEEEEEQRYLARRIDSSSFVAGSLIMKSFLLTTVFGTRN